MEERLQKILSQAGVASRRASEELILAGRVRVNNRVAELGQKADPARDKITVDGRPVESAPAMVYIALHKPRNVLSTVEAEWGDNRRTVLDLVPNSGGLHPVGRLDFDSEGLILLTNDGDLTNRLTHPRYGHEKEYRVLVARHPDTAQMELWRRGIVLEDGYKTAPAQVRTESESGKGMWLRVVLREGRKRQIREMGNLTGLPVVRIVRIRIGTVLLGVLKPGEWRELSAKEVEELRAGVKPLAAAKRPQRRNPHARRPMAKSERAPEKKPGRRPPPPAPPRKKPA
jgi:23S rRNA pseudouridine2605 synthase